MTQDELLELLSARIDGELSPDQHETLELHLRENPDDRVLLEAFQLQDVQLRETFEPHRKIAECVAERLLTRPKPTTAPTARPDRRRPWLVFAVAASLMVALFAWQWRHRDLSVADPIKPISDLSLVDAGTHPKPLPELKKLAPVPEGTTVETQPGERKRLALADGSTLFVNQNSKVTLLGKRELSLESGEIYLQAVPADETSDHVKFVVKASGKTLTALGTRFAVRAAEGVPNLLVTQGKVQVNDREAVDAGRQLSFGSQQSEPAPRANVALDWTRELLQESETPLVPQGNHVGGDLVAVDPYGQEAKLSLVNYHIDVHIEDGFARTTIDQTYFNHENFRMEGTFYFPLPPDASLSRLAMYVDGNLMEGGMAERDHARQTYEQIRHSMRDPALLEWIDGSMFKMRVFPLEARQEKRILLSYSQKLPSAYGRTTYRFPAGHSLNLVDSWSFRSFVKNGDKLKWFSPSHPKMKREVSKQEGLTLVDSAKNIKLDRDLVLELIDESVAPTQGESVGWSSTEHDGQRYLMLNYRPDLPSEPRRERRDWVFLFESSGARDPLLARTQVEIVRSLLTQAEHDDTFNVLTVGTRVTPWQAQPQIVNSTNIDTSIRFLESTHLIGATDLEAGLATAVRGLKSSRNPYLVHLGGGVASLGECRSDRLVSLIPAAVKYVGVAVGKRFAPQLMKVAAEKTGGYFTQINPDESVAWRGFELFSALNAPRLLKIQTDTGTPTKMLSFSNGIVQGETYSCVCKLPGGPKQDPTQVTLRGLLNGVPFEKVIKIEKVATLAAYLPRTWAKLEIDRLLAEDSTGNKNRIIELSKQMYVMTPYTSLLVLENKQMYRQFNVDRGRKDHWALYPAPAKIPVVYIPDASRPLDANAPNLNGQKPHENQVRATITGRSSAPVLAVPPSSEPDDMLVKVYSRGESVHWGKTNLWGETDETSFLGLSSATRAKLLRSAGGNADILDREQLLDRFEDAVRLQSSSEVEELRQSVLSPDAQILRVFERGGRRKAPFTEEFNFIAADDSPLPPGLAEERSRSRLSRRGLGTNGRTWNFALGDLDADSPLSSDVTRNYAAYNFQTLALDFAYPARGTEFAERITTAPVSGRLLFKQKRIDELVAERPAAPPQEYRRPQFARDERLFTDLVALAPGMSALPADFDAAIEQEAAPRFGSRLGKIDPEARRLIDTVRSSDWRETTVGGVAIRHDGRRRYAYERKLPLGLIEKVYCDGTHLWHLYPELGIGAKREVSRFHRADFASIIPDLLLAPEDLARGADLLLGEPGTVVLRPVGVDVSGKANWVERHLRIEGGRVVEKKTVVMPAKNLVARLTLYADGKATLTDEKAKQLDTRTLTYRKALAPPTAPDLTGLVVLPLPIRDRNTTYLTLHLDPNIGLDQAPNACFEYLPEDDVLRLIACEYAAGQGRQVEHLWRERFFKYGDRRIGFLTLIRGGEWHLAPNELLRSLIETKPDDPLVRYLALQSELDAGTRNRERHAAFGHLIPFDLIESNTFLGRMSAFRALSARWDSDWVRHRYLGWHPWEVDATLRFVKTNADNPLGVAMLSLLSPALGDGPIQRRVAEAWKLVGERTGSHYAPRYEEARAYYAAGEVAKAQELFGKLYADTLQEGTLPAVDPVFRSALEEDRVGESWPKLMKETARKCLEKYRPVVVRLAWKCSQLGDLPLAETLLDKALTGLDESPLAIETRLAAIEFLSATGRFDRAAAIIDDLLKIGDNRKEPSLWRMAARIAGQREQTLPQIACLETALDLEFRELPPVVDLQSLRNDYGKLMSHYEYLVQASTDLKLTPPTDLASRVVRASDRWRSLDPEADNVCRRAAGVLRRLGDDGKSLAWDYLTTPLALRPNESSPWLSLAETLDRQGEHALADRCFSQAFSAEPTNAEILWNRAQHLQRSGDSNGYRKLLRELSEGDWQPRFQWLRTQARMTLEGR